MKTPKSPKRTKPTQDFRSKKLTELTTTEKYYWYFKYTSFVLILFGPILVFFFPQYWTNFILSPKFYLSSFLFFFIPFCLILSKPFLRNPFFLAPFSISFILSTITSEYEDFIRYYCFFFSFITTLFAIYRTRPPYRAIERRFYKTNYFIDYFEVRYFWRIVIIIILLLFLPFLYFHPFFFQRCIQMF